MKILLQSAVAIAALVGPGVAHAGLIDYAKVSVGQSVNSEISGINLEDGFAYGAALGGDLGPIRFEAGVDHLSGDLNFGPSVQGEALDYHANAYLDIPVGDNASLFAGAGLDYIDAQASFGPASMSADGTGWNWAVGGAYRINDRMVAEAQFRRVDATLDFAGGDLGLSSDELTFGLRLQL